MSMKNSSDIIRDQTCDLPACSTVPQPTAPPRAPLKRGDLKNISVCSILFNFYPLSYANILHLKFMLIQMLILTDLLFVRHN
jgi:hypothetical protein